MNPMPHKDRRTLQGVKGRKPKLGLLFRREKIHPLACALFGLTLGRYSSTQVLCLANPASFAENHSLFQSDIVCTSGTYSYGYAATSADLLAGDYTIIVSSFEPQRHFGPFSLRVESSRRFDIRPIPPEGAGMYSKIVKGSW